MYVRMKVGGRAGEILDVEPVSARSLLASGAGEDPYAAPSDKGAPDTAVPKHAAKTPVKRTKPKR